VACGLLIGHLELPTFAVYLFIYYVNCTNVHGK